MKITTRTVYSLACLVAITVTSTALLTAAETEDGGETKASIQVEGKVKSIDLPAMAKITFKQAVDAALVVVPGSIIAAELEVEDKALMYSFEIVTAEKKIMEVEIDAGNGKVLDIEEE